MLKPFLDFRLSLANQESEKDQLISSLTKENASLREENSSLREEVNLLRSELESLRSQISKNSRNSHKPSSSNGFKSPKRSPGRKRKKNKGGQRGHEGQTLEFHESPDEIIHLPLEECPGCHCDLSSSLESPSEVRQVFDIPPIALHVTQFEAQRKWCECCQKQVTAAFPQEVKAPIQYGLNLKSFALYLHYEQLLPLRRVAQTLESLLGVGIHPQTILNHSSRLDDTLFLQTQWIASQLSEASFLHNDETSLKLKGKLHWLHVNSTSELTLYTASPHRGKKGLVASDILPFYSDLLIHDAWRSYDSYGTQHAFCGAHLLRELQAIMEQEGAFWARDLQSWMRQELKYVQELKAFGEKEYPEFEKQLTLQKLQTILSQGQTYYQMKDPPRSGKRGRKAQHKGKNLLDRFIQNTSEMIRWLLDFEVPFDNNQAERDLRMMKLRHKTSGSFQQEHSLQRFCAIRSVFSSIKKKGAPLFDSIKEMISQTQPQLLSAFD